MHDRYHGLPAALRALVPGALLMLVAGAMFLIVLDAVREGDDISTLDLPLLNWMASIRTPWLTTSMTFVTYLFGPVVLPIIVAVSCGVWGAVTKRWRDPALLAGAMIMSTALSTLVKVLVGRERPLADFQVVAGYEASFSFPSGHATGASTLVLVTGYLLWRGRRGNWRLTMWLAASVVIIALVGGTRLYLGYHFLSDVIAGACLGLVTLGIVVIASQLLDLRAARRADAR